MQILSTSKLSNIESVTHYLLRSLNVKFNFKSLSYNLKKHHEYPSLLAISDTLTEWSVYNRAYKIPKEDYNVNDLEFPFVAHTKEGGGRYMLVHDIKNEKVTVSDEHKRQYRISEKEFLNRWDGIVLHAEVTSESGEKNYNTKKIEHILQKLALPSLLFVVITMLGFIFSKQIFLWDMMSLTLLKLTGIVIGILLLVQNFNSNNPLIKNLCGFGDKDDCNAILKSEAAKVTPWLSWSEVGFFYFSGSFMFLILDPKNIGLIGWFNIIALPYTVYSISYQYRAKKWCILCCSVQVLLILELFCFISIFNGRFPFEKVDNLFSISIQSIYLLIFCFLTPITIWGVLKPFFLAKVQLEPLRMYLNKYKHNTQLFMQVLMNQTRYNIRELTPVVLGNPEGEHIITIVSNPLCGSCSKAHQDIEELLKLRGDIRVNIILSTKVKNDEQAKIVKHMMALAQKRNITVFEEAISDWFNSKNKSYENWAKKHPAFITPDLEDKIVAHAAWIKTAEIKYTPTILFNGYILPEPYKIDDLKYLL